jgi:ferrochelatase
MALNDLIDQRVGRIIIIPLFPQYAPATTGSIIHRVKKLYEIREGTPEIRFVEYFFDHADYIEAVSGPGKSELERVQYDHVLFSFHGVPERQIRKNAPSPQCDLSSTCCTTLHEGNFKCYRAQCFATTRLLAKSMGIPADKYTVTFQSRLGRSVWLQPYTSSVAQKLPKEGKKKVLVFSPSFVTDCLETTIELGVENMEIFKASGGEKWKVMKSLNDSKSFITVLTGIVNKQYKR